MKRRQWEFAKRVPGTQCYGFVLCPYWVANGEHKELLLATTNKAGRQMSGSVRIPLNDADIDRLCIELKRAVAGPLGQIAYDMELGLTTTVMETDNS